VFLGRFLYFCTSRNSRKEYSTIYFTQLGWSGKFYQLLCRIFLSVSTGTSSRPIKIYQKRRSYYNQKQSVTVFMAHGVYRPTVYPFKDGTPTLLRLLTMNVSSLRLVFVFASSFRLFYAFFIKTTVKRCKILWSVVSSQFWPGVEKFRFQKYGNTNLLDIFFALGIILGRYNRYRPSSSWDAHPGAS